MNIEQKNYKAKAKTVTKHINLGADHAIIVLPI